MDYAEKRFDDLVDEARGRRVPVTALWPSRPPAPAGSPLIVLSHGGAAHRGSYAYLATHLARHGYVVAIPEHVGSSTRAILRGMWDQRSGLRSVLEAMARDTAEWRARPADVRFVIDQATRWNEGDADLRRRIDLERLGVLGHSYGAYTALVIAGALVQLTVRSRISATRACGHGIDPRIEGEKLRIGPEGGKRVPCPVRKSRLRRRFHGSR